MLGTGWRRSLSALLGVALATLACALPGAGGEGATTGEEGSETDEGAPNGDDEDALTNTGLDTSTLDSYRSQYEMTFAGTDDTGAPLELRYSANRTSSSEQQAASILIASEGTRDSEGESTTLYTQIEDTAYFLSGGECFVFLVGDASPGEQVGAPVDFLAGADLSGAERILPDEDVNGVMARHYRFTGEDVDLSDAGLSDVTGDIWVAVDGGFVVRQEASAERSGVDGDGAQGHLEWTYDVSDVGQPVSISAPDECENPAADVPVMADAADVSAFGGLVSYVTSAPIEEVVAFYQEAMAEQGWTPGAALTDNPEGAFLDFTRGEEKVSVFVSQADGDTSVMVTAE